MKKSAINRIVFLTFTLGLLISHAGFCADINLIVKARGTKANGVYAHFKLYVNDLECGSKYTRESCKEYCFRIPFATDEIKKITLKFDNDFYTVGEDRSLIVSCIYVGDELPIKATEQSTRYVKQNGEEVDYSGVMQWNGSLIFDLTKIKRHSGDIALTSQAEVDAFSLNYVKGDLLISGDDITNLDALSSLIGVKGSLIIKENPVLSSIRGLNAVMEIGFISIEDNASLAHIDGFDALHKCGGMQIEDNAALKSINCFNSTEIIQ